MSERDSFDEVLRRMQRFRDERDRLKAALERIEVTADLYARSCRDIGNDRAEQFEGLRDIAKDALAGGGR